jgi:dynein heavy chain
MESAPAKVPWQDLRYLFGEIMYGGHIVNDLDRQLANTYLDFYMKEDLLEEMPLYPFMDSQNAGEVLRAPSTGLAYEKVLEYIDEELKQETPLAFGLHPNAEITYYNNAAKKIWNDLLMMKSTDSGSSGGNS